MEEHDMEDWRAKNCMPDTGLLYRMGDRAVTKKGRIYSFTIFTIIYEVAPAFAN